MAFIPSRQFAQLAGISARKAGSALARIAGGHKDTWRGARLVVRTIAGRGGRSGLRYEVDVESLPGALRERFKSLSNLPAAPLPPTVNSAMRTLYLAVLERPLSHEKGSRERARAIRALAEQTIVDPETGTLKKFSIRALQRLVAAYDVHGVAGLDRKRRSDAGRARVVISRRWDEAAASLPRETMAAIRAEVVGYIRSQHKNHESTGNIAFKARDKLEGLTRKQGVEPPRGACDVPRAMIAAEFAYRKAALRRLDAKAFADDLPGVRRTREGARPMEIVFADVHPIDILLREFDGLQRYAVGISWLDIATNRIWMTVLVLPKGEGVRNEHVIDSFIEMAREWGLPETIYLDNGSEYKCIHYLRDALSVAFPGGRRVIVKARPYNARAKPIEGVFKNLEYNHFAKLPGYVGGDRMKKKTANVGREPTPFGGDVADFQATIAASLTIYHAKPQPKALGGLSPSEVLGQAIGEGWTKTGVDPEAFETVFSTEETREVRQGFISVGGRIWTCDALQSYLGKRVIVLIPKFSRWARLPIKDEKGRLLGFAQEDRPYGYLDPAGAKEAGRRKNLRVVSAREMDRSAATIDPVAEVHALASALPKATPAPAGATLAASDEQKRISSGVKESAKERRDREAGDRTREHEEQMEISRRLLANLQKRPA